MEAPRTDVDGIASTLERFVRIEGSVAADDTGFGRGVDLLEAGYLDSLGIVHLISFIEREFSLSLSDEVLADTRIATIDGIATILGEEMRGNGGYENHADRSAGR